MAISVNREEFLGRLQSVEPGLAKREIVQQSACFAFIDGMIMTFNEEIACRIKSKIDPEFSGAVQASPLLTLLSKMKEETIDLEMTDSELIISGVRKKSGIRVEKEIMLEISVVSKPGKWAELNEDFHDAIELVAACAGRDESKHNLVCVHITPKFMEAMDNNKAIKYKIKTPVEENSLIRHDSLKHVVSLGMTKMSDTKDWMHFKNDSGLILSCRKYLEEYPDLTGEGIFNVKGTPTVLPGGLAEAVEKAQIFSSENTDDDKVLIELKSGKMWLKGEGINGWHEEVKKVKYKGRPIEFLVSPTLLIEISKRHTACEINETRLKVEGKNFVYVSLLSKVRDTDVPDVEEESEEKEEGDE